MSKHTAEIHLEDGEYKVTVDGSEIKDVEAVAVQAVKGAGTTSRLILVINTGKIVLHTTSIEKIEADNLVDLATKATKKYAKQLEKNES